MHDAGHADQMNEAIERIRTEIGIGRHVSVQTFDCLLIDCGLLEAIGDAATGSAEWTRHVVTRNRVKRQINAAAANIDEPFQIIVVKNGEQYFVEPLSDNASRAPERRQRKIALTITAGKGEMKSYLARSDLKSDRRERIVKYATMLEVLEAQHHTVSEMLDRELSEIRKVFKGVQGGAALSVVASK